MSAADKTKRSIPARAGEPSWNASTAIWWPVYPRACGGTDQERRINQMVTGLSPRVRGNHCPGIRRRGRHGSIPARAGEPASRSSCRPATTVYPRACGGTRTSGAAVKGLTGLSPRVRGNPHPLCCPPPAGGSIPARAGEPSRRLTRCPARTVYPRARGGTISVPSVMARVMGLSPRVRGNPQYPLFSGSP